MGKITIVAMREFWETVRTKAFLLSSVLLPVLIVGLVFGSEWVQGVIEGGEVPARRIAVIDETGVIYPRLLKETQQYNLENANHPFALEDAGDDRQQVATLVDEINMGSDGASGGTLYAYLLIPADAIDGAGVSVLGRKDNQLAAGRAIQGMVWQAIDGERFARFDPPIDPVAVQSIQNQRQPLRSVDVVTGEEATGNELARFMMPFAFMFLLFMGTFGISQGLLTSMIEEKSSRVIEVLLSAISPLQLMAGKILGMVAVGLLLLTIWGAIGYFSARYQEMGYLVTGPLLIYATIYFVPAFLLFAAILGGIGAACNTLKEAQSMTFPLSLITTVPLVLWFQISEHPNSTLSLVLSFIPPVTPFVMILRICADPGIPLWQVIATQALLWATVVAAIWAAARVFRIGVLMYGKPPTLVELARWVRRP